MSKKIILIFAAMAVLLAACGQQAPPTLSPSEVEGTAVAAAWTMVAMTQEAIPTNTPIPPTETPSPTPEPTFTPEPVETLPTLELIIPTATQAVSSNTDQCLGPINFAQAGPTTPLTVVNETGGNITVSLNLRESAFGQCGALAVSLGRNERTRLNLPRGTWFAYFWMTSGGNRSGGCTFVLRPADTDRIRLLVREDGCRDLP
jgi:hypothetical protein